MVTINPNELPTGTTVATTHRGFVPAGEVVVPALVQSPGLSWGGIIGGAVAALAIMAFSGALAYACEVSTTRPPDALGAGGIYFGWVAAIWAWITAAVAFYVGGMIAALVARGRYLASGMLQGFLAWSLVLALGLFFSGATIGALQFAGTGLRYNLITPATGELPVNLALAAWSAFICIGVGLVASLIGGSVGGGKLTRVAMVP